MGRQEPDDFQRWERDVATNCVRAFIREGHRVPGMEEEDLVQEARLHWFRVKERYNAEHGVPRQGFMLAVVGNHLLDLLKRALRKKRQPLNRALSLDAPLAAEDEGETHVDVIPDPDSDRHTTAQALFGHDVARLLAQMSDRERRLCDLLSDEVSLSEASRRLSVSRPTLYQDLARIRKLFEDAGLGDDGI